MPRKVEHFVSDGSGTQLLSFVPTDPALLRLWGSGLRQVKDSTFTLALGSRAIAFADPTFPPAGDLITADYPYATP